MDIGEGLFAMSPSNGPIAFDHLNMDYQYDSTLSQLARNDDTHVQHMDTKDSMKLQQDRIPSILVDCIRNNIRQLNYNKNITNSQNFPYLPSYNNIDNENHRIHPKMYYDSERGMEYPIQSVLCYKSASRPIRRTPQEKNRLQMEDKMMIASEMEYDHATWRMYHRIMKYRQKCPLPDSYYDEVSSRKNHNNNSNNNSDGSDDMLPSDITAITSSSTASSPSSNSPKFASIRHSSTIIKNQGDDINNKLHQSKIPGLPTVVSSSTTDHHAIDDSDHDHEDEYCEMMMFDLEL
jgi:hypothetical protein